MNAQNNAGRTPLIAACHANSIHSASKLVKNGMCGFYVQCCVCTCNSSATARLHSQVPILM